MPNDNSLNEILGLIEKFGFKFFGYSEAKDPLVIAPNGQVIPLNVAYNFVKSQIAKANSAGSGGPEAMPQMPNVIPEINPETRVETKVEQGKIEKESGPEINLPVLKTPSAPISTSPKISMDKPSNPASPFGDGFTVNIDPNDVEKAEDYVKQHSQTSNTSSAKWLALEFEKYLAELRSSQNNKKSV